MTDTPKDWPQLNTKPTSEESGKSPEGFSSFAALAMGRAMAQAGEKQGDTHLKDVGEELSRRAFAAIETGKIELPIKKR